VTVVTDGGLRGLHDTLESAYLALLAQGSARHFERRRDGYTLVGFAGLASPSMNRVASIDVPPARIGEMVEDAHDLFRERGLPWCVHVTPFTRPSDLESRLGRFRLLSELSVMVHDPAMQPRARPRAAPGDLRVRELEARELPLFLNVTLETFGMSRGFFPGLLDITAGWVESGGRAYVAELDGEVVGCGLLSRSEDVGGVYNMGTKPSARRRGVATAILRRIIRDQEESGGGLLTLQVTRDAYAEALYRSLGFERAYSWRLLAPRTYH